jgi:hypothetical protein
MDLSREPSADQRAGAREMFDLYNAMRQEGFTEFQACAILGTWLGTIGKGNSTDA